MINDLQGTTTYRTYHVNSPIYERGKLLQYVYLNSDANLNYFKLPDGFMRIENIDHLSQ